ncbi:MAG: hypothetical protein KKE62_16380 [Proteobacteria bacterium]|nr:hypothetical protein [Pseudomonadota bacterium]MBU1389543.1 hypothetical protein [Pseudomonadota bacterium]MBU1544407.1 hypothetical protein [Pseudomonadota bacterium]MBU2480681.1 hypothetical protein [Pseudomonadota bacterium]
MKPYKPLYKIYAAILIAVIILLVSFFIVPDYLKIKTLDTEINNLTQTLEIQLKLGPLYHQISARADLEKVSSLNVPSKGWLDRAQIINISKIFQDLADKNDLECLKSNPDVDTLSGDAEIMLTHIVLTGKFEQFRQFLFDITRLDYLDSFEEIRCISEQTGKKYMLKIWISIK